MTFNRENPFALRSTLEYELPPFEQIREEHYLAAFYAGTEAQLIEVAEIIKVPEQANFENTIVALERSGQVLNRMLLVFYNKSSSDTSASLEAIEEEIAPKLAAHTDSIRLNQVLFARIKRLYENRHTLSLESEDLWLLERYYRDFIHAGAHLDEGNRAKLKQANEKLSKLETQFSKNVLADTNDLAVIVDDLTQLDGLGENEIAAAANAAADRGLTGKWLIGAVNFTGNPVLGSLRNRELRQRIMDASRLKGNRDNENDNKLVLLQMAELRAERAKLFGVRSHAEYVIQEQTAEQPDNVHNLLRQIVPTAVRNAKTEGADLQTAIAAKGEDFALQSWDWDLYSEQVRL